MSAVCEQSWPVVGVSSSSSLKGIQCQKPTGYIPLVNPLMVLLYTKTMPLCNTIKQCSIFFSLEIKLFKTKRICQLLRALIKTAVYGNHRRRMEREAKAKVVASVWGPDFCSIPCCTICFASVSFEETVEFILFFQVDRGKTASAARN